MLLKGRMSFSKPNDPLLPSSLPFIVEDHPAHSCSSAPGYIIDLSLGWKLAVFQSHTLTAVPDSGRTDHMCAHKHLLYNTRTNIIHNMCMDVTKNKTFPHSNAAVGSPSLSNTRPLSGHFAGFIPTEEWMRM